MPIVNGKYVAPVWQNGVGQPLDADELNAISTRLANLDSYPILATALPAAGSPLVDGTEYTVADPVGTYAFTFPEGDFEVWIRFTVASTFSITFPTAAKFINVAPTFIEGIEVEMSIKNGVVAVGQVVSA